VDIKLIFLFIVDIDLIYINFHYEKSEFSKTFTVCMENTVQRVPKYFNQYLRFIKYDLKTILYLRIYTIMTHAYSP